MGVHTSGRVSGCRRRVSAGSVSVSQVVTVCPRPAVHEACPCPAWVRARVSASLCSFLGFLPSLGHVSFQAAWGMQSLWLACPPPGALARPCDTSCLNPFLLGTVALG